MIEEFRDLVPDAPERIFRQWEEESAHRRSYEQKALDAAIRRETRGQVSAALFALTALTVAAFALWKREPWVAATIGGGTIVSVVGAFLYRRASGKASQTGPHPPRRR